MNKLLSSLLLQSKGGSILSESYGLLKQCMNDTWTETLQDIQFYLCNGGVDFLPHGLWIPTKTPENFLMDFL